MTDHQQAAIEAGINAISGGTISCTHGYASISRGDAENIIDAVLPDIEPHLRKKWAEEIRNGVNPTDTGEMQEWRLGFITGVLRTARFLEYAGEQTPKRKVPHTGPGHSAGDPSFCEGCLAELEGAGE